MNRMVSNIMRLAVVTNVDHDSGIAYTRWIDQNTEGGGPDIPIPHPYPGIGGEGIFVGLKEGSIVVLGTLSYERYIPVSILSLPGLYGNLDSIGETHFDDVGAPSLKSGDVVIQGADSGQLRFDNDGVISLNNAFDEGIVYSGEYNNSVRCSIETAPPVQYIISSSGLQASGIVRRDVRISEDDGNFSDFLINLESEQMLEEVGWDVTKQTTYVTRSPTSEGSLKTDNKNLRNPAFVENRQVIFEFGREWAVSNFESELERSKNDLISIHSPDERREHRSNILSLSLSHPNELIEKVDGTLVDIFGNLLTINKSILPPPDGNNNKELLENIFELSRHTVAHHIEINTKKGLAYRNSKVEEGLSPLLKPIFLNGYPDVSSSENNARDRSRWSLRVDKEGLTTLNIPSTSETGNVPLLTRQENSSEIEVDEIGNPKKNGRNDEASLFIYRNNNQQDIFHDQFGPGGISIEPSYSQIKNRLKGNVSSWKDETNKYATLPEYVEAGTAFHEITNTAITILRENINKRAADIFKEENIETDMRAVSNKINPQYPTENTSVPTRDDYGLINNYPNAGGRSAQINLDGSLETSIGANTIDRTSWTIDTAGSIVARLGRDRSGRSAIIQSDGSIVLEVGGFDFVGETTNDTTDTRFAGGGWPREETLPKDQRRFRDGKIVIRLRRANTSQSGPDEDDTLLILDDSGVTLQTVGRLNLVSGEDMTLKSDSRILFESPIVQNYIENPRFVTRNGRRM